MTTLNGLHFENIVFEGGGIKGVAYIGALKALNKLDKMKHIKRTIGTSVGSIFALLTSMKCTDEQIDKYFWTLLNEMTKFHDNIFTETSNFINNMGLHNNENMYNAVNLIISELYNKNNITFAQLYELTNTELTVVATCLSTRKIAYFNHTSYPDMEVAKSIQISTSVPLFYTMTKWDNMIWADGAIVENFPIEYFDNSDGTFDENTLGFLFEYDTKKQKLYSIDNLVDLFGGIENTFLENNVRQSINKTQNRFIIDIDTGDISSLDFNIPQDKLDFLINQGLKSTMEFFSGEDDVKHIDEANNNASTEANNNVSTEVSNDACTEASNDVCTEVSNDVCTEASNNDGIMDKLYRLFETLKFW
jgi:NTE family protein